MRLTLPVVALCGALAACALSPEGRADSALRPRALLDAYLIAHGMAASYAESAEANPTVVLELAKLDIKAAASVRSLTRLYDANVTATAEAVAALTTYAARQSAVTQ